MAARAEVHIKGSETVSTAAERASGSLHQLRASVKDTVQPMKDLSGSVKDLLAFGGLAAAAMVLYRGLSDCEKAFEKLNPQMAKMPGSITSFTSATDGLKASVGGLISAGMSPLREWLSNLFGEWTRNIKAANDYRTALTNLDNYVGGSDIKKRLQSSTFDLNFYASQLSALQYMKYEGIKTAEDLAEITRKMIEASYSQYAAAMRQSGAMAKATQLMNPPPPAGATGPQWSLDRAEMAAVEFARIMRNEAENRAKAEQAIADAREMAAVEFARIMREATDATVSAWTGFIGDMTGFGQVILSPPELPTTNLGLWTGGGGGGGDITGILTDFSDALGPIISSLITFDPLLQAAQIVFSSMMAVLQPVIDTVIQPLIGVFVILGQELGQVLVPAILALSPIIDLMAKQFIWVSNYVLRPVFNFLWATFTNFGAIIGWVINKIVALGTTIWYIVSFQWGKLGSVDWGGAFPTMVTPAQGPIQEIDLAALTDAGAAYQAAGGASSNTTVQHPPDIYVYVTYEGPIFGDGGEARAGGYIVDAIEAYLGTGARVTFLEA